MFEALPLMPVDPVLGLMAEFKALKGLKKVNLGVGIYRDEEGLSPPFKAVVEAEKFLALEALPKDYLPIDGSPEFIKAASRLVWGALAEREGMVSLQSVGGTSALNTAARLLRAAGVKTLHIPDKTWANHKGIFEGEGFALNPYGHLDWARLNALPEKSVVLFHAACHNPTGRDPTKGEWENFFKTALKRGYTLIFDNAYQGFGEGLEEDAWAYRKASEMNIPSIVTTSFSKNFGLYGERVGLLTLSLRDQKEAERTLSYAKACVRAIYSNPPLQGARIIQKILSTPELNALWKEELEARRERIVNVRESLKDLFPSLTHEKGFFTLLPITPEQTERLKEEFSVLVMRTGRANLSGINDSNLAYVKEAFRKVL